jgi:hypothetical protein
MKKLRCQLGNCCVAHVAFALDARVRYGRIHCSSMIDAKERVPGRELAPMPELAGKVRRMADVVVRALFGFSLLDTGKKWLVEKGDTGVLHWSRRPRYGKVFELLIVWDRDPARKPRRLVHAGVEIIGLQIDSHRIIVAQISPISQ